MPIRRLAAILVLTAIAVACTRSATSRIVPVTPSTSSRQISLPSGLATPFGEALPAGDVPPTSLVPAGTDPVGSWFAQTTAGDAIVVAWQAPGSDPFRTDRGFVVWRHTGDPSLWRPVFAGAYPAARHPVLGITSTIADVTGDGSQDALVFAETGGSGACGTYHAIDVAAGTEVFRRSVCDTTIQPSTGSPGLVVTEAVYAHDDPHCCPSDTRTTVLQRDAAGDWRPISMTTTPT